MRTCLAQLALLIASILSVVSCGTQQAEYAGEVGTLAATTVEAAPEDQNRTAPDPVTGWKKFRPQLAPALQLMGKPAKDIKGVLGEPKGSGVPANYQSMQSGGEAHDSLTYSWELPAKDDPARDIRDSRGWFYVQIMNLGVAVGNQSKQVEAVWGRWANVDGTLPPLTVMVNELGLDVYSGDLYGDPAFSGQHEVTWVFVKDGVMTKIVGWYAGELTKTKTETDFETGKSKSTTYLSPEFSMAKVGVFTFYIGSASINPFSWYAIKPEITGQPLPTRRG